MRKELHLTPTDILHIAEVLHCDIQFYNQFGEESNTTVLEEISKSLKKNFNKVKGTKRLLDSAIIR